MRIGSGQAYDASLYTRVTPVKRYKQDQNSEDDNSTDSTQKPEAKEQVAKLQSVDTKVRTHEAAHQAAGGGLAGGASFGYAKGPDGKQYAVSGEVPIDMSPENTPEATISKMSQVRAAALAPADPSPQDLKVASSASIMAMKAKLELNKKNSPDGKDKKDEGEADIAIA